MRASLDLAGLEVELLVPQGPLELAITAHYAPFLASVRAPACRFRIETARDWNTGGCHRRAGVQWTGPAQFEVADSEFLAAVDLAGEGTLWTTPELAVIDRAFRSLVALLAPRHGAVLLNAPGVIAGGRAHLFFGADPLDAKAALAEQVTFGSYVLVRRPPTVGWMAGSVPFAAPNGHVALPRLAQLDRLWVQPDPALAGSPWARRQHLARTVMKSAYSAPDPLIADIIHDLVYQLVNAVPASQAPSPHLGGAFVE